MTRQLQNHRTLAKRAYILGCGKSGSAAIRFLKERGWEVIGIDAKADLLRNSPPFSGASLISEKEFREFLPNSLLVKSPGIPWTHPIVKRANDEKIPITSEIELGLNALSEKGKKLFAITGSNGKTTTTLLTAHILNEAKRNAVACGNVGVAILDCVDKEADFFIVEVSSFQLEELKGPYFDCGIVLNITDNHLDRYQSKQDYASAKFQLMNCLKEKGKLYFGPSLFRDFPKESEKALSFPQFSDEEKIATILNSSYEKTWIKAHDVENLQAAYAIASEVNISEELFWQGAMSFVKPPHRIEFVGRREGVDYINDSKATSVDAVTKAIKAIKKPLILIAGGVDKGGDYREWIPAMMGKVRCVVAMGAAKKRIAESLSDSVTVMLAENLKEALSTAAREAKKGDCVLLSPGCSSYDQFRNYEERGNAFKELVNKLGT